MNKKHENSDLACKHFNFNNFNIGDEEFNKLSDYTKYKRLQLFFKKINELKKVKHRPEATKKRKIIVCNALNNLFNQQKGKLDDDYNELLHKLKKRLTLDIMLKICFLKILFIKTGLYHH